MNKFAIVVIAYNRPGTVIRLLNSLKEADFDGDKLTLIVSLDNCGDDSVFNVVNNFRWDHGEKIILTYPERLGLKEHILRCGNLTQLYENIIVFEDDLYVSRSFYRYVKQTVKFYETEDKVAGIALYSHQWNVGCDRPFLPVQDEYDVFFLQYACSWGQVWSKNKWSKFMEWYEFNNQAIESSPLIPSNVTKWPTNSWLKYHIKYCIETDRYFVYPRVSLSTNFGTKGEHNRKNNNGYQVPLQMEHKITYSLPTFNQARNKYDAFFENINIGNYINIDNDLICVDLYGMKGNSIGKPYWLTLETKEFKIIESFDLSLRPHDMNVIEGICGDYIKLYDTSITYDNDLYLDVQKVKIQYDIRNIPWRHLAYYVVKYGFERIWNKIQKGV